MDIGTFFACAILIGIPIGLIWFVWYVVKEIRNYNKQPVKTEFKKRRR